MRYLSLDTETGGFEGTSLLSIGIIVADTNLNTLSRVHWLVKPNPVDGRSIYAVEADGLAVNKINLIEHDKHAIPYKEVRSLLYEYLKEWSLDGHEKLIPLGKQIVGDIRKIRTELPFSKGSWETFVSHRAIELSSIAIFLRACGLLFSDSNSLSDIAKYYKLDTSGVHDALFDANLNIQIYKAMLASLKGI